MLKKSPIGIIKKVMNYADKATAVVTAARENIDEFRYISEVRYAAKIYDKVSAQCKEILDDMVKNGETIPPSSSRASIPLKTIVATVFAEDKKTLSR